MKVQHFVGIDISSDVLDVCVLKSNQVIFETQVKNQFKPIRKLFGELAKDGVSLKNSFVCAEHTGNYGEELKITLEDLGFTYFIVPAIEIKLSIGLTRGKNDKIDARRIAEYCSRFSDKLKPSKLPEKYLGDLKSLFTYRASLIKSRTSKKNLLKSFERLAESAPKRDIIKDLKKRIKQEDRTIEGLDYKMLEIIRDHPEANDNFKLITSVVGIGQVTACYLIIVTENFSLFDDARKFASYSGIAPFENTSGSSVRGKTKTSRLRNRQAKALLLNGVNASISGNNEMAKYYQRKIIEGKHKNVVKNAIAFKIIGRVFAVVKRQTPYVNLYSDNIAA